MIILNLGCGTRTSPHCINIDWSTHLRLRNSWLGTALAKGFLLRGERLRRFNSMSGDVVVHDLRKGIPAEDATVDAVYHSHTLEHLDRHLVPGFFAEVLRVLREGGVHRIVVPDLERDSRRYLAHLDRCLADPQLREEHDAYVADIIEQMVRREANGTSHQPPIRRAVENLVLGDARRRGETHQWMYDRINLTHSLDTAGFRDISIVDHRTSRIADWSTIALDEDEDGREYKPGSLYVEAIK